MDITQISVSPSAVKMDKRVAKNFPHKGLLNCINVMLHLIAIKIRISEAVLNWFTVTATTFLVQQK